MLGLVWELQKGRNEAQVAAIGIRLRGFERTPTQALDVVGYVFARIWSTSMACGRTVCGTREELPCFSPRVTTIGANEWRARSERTWPCHLAAEASISAATMPGLGEDPFRSPRGLFKPVKTIRSEGGEQG